MRHIKATVIPILARALSTDTLVQLLKDQTIGTKAPQLFPPTSACFHRNCTSRTAKNNRNVIRTLLNKFIFMTTSHKNKTTQIL